MGARFCSSCGHQLAVDHDVRTEGFDLVMDPSAQPTEIGAEAVLAVTAGHRSGTRYGIRGETVTVGRHPKSDVFLDDITVSRRHVELARSLTGYDIKDVGSLNGTYVNGVRIDGSEPLTNGDEVQVGKFKMLFLLTSTGGVNDGA